MNRQNTHDCTDVGSTTWPHQHCPVSILDEGADVNTLEAHGSSALMYASYHGDTETVHLLLSHDATANTQDMNGITALMIAACLGFPEIIHLLLNYGADVSIQDNGNN